MDWNWFFSSVAESTAAIVGIFAAFIITKIINNQSVFKNKANEIELLLSQSKKFIDLLDNRYFEWYNTRIREQQLLELYDMYEEYHSSDPDFYFNKLSFSPYDNNVEIIDVISTKIVKIKSGDFSKLSDFNIYNQNLDNLIINEREALDQNVLEIKNHIRNISRFLVQVKDNPESSKVVNYSIVSIITLFFTGVVYPLSFLPLKTGQEIILSFDSFFYILFSFKGGILFIVSIIFLSIMLLFLYINITLRYNESKLTELENYTDIQRYSIYLKYLIENQNDKSSIVSKKND